LIQLPGIKNPANALKVVGQTAELRFRPVLCNGQTFPPYAGAVSSGGSTTTTTKPATTTTTTPATTTTKPASGTGLGSGGRTPGAVLPAQTPTPTTSPQPSSTTSPQASPPLSAQYCSLATTAQGAQIPTTPLPDDPNATVLLPNADKNGNADLSGPRYLLGPTQLTGRVVSTASAQPPDIGNGGTNANWFVSVTFTGSGGPQFDKLAAANYQKQVAIVLDGVVVSAPTIQQQTFNGRAQITGNFTQHSAGNLALQLRYGSLPVQFQPQSIQTVSATIGKDSLRAGLLAGAIGLILVFAYILFYYRALGVVVILGLTVSGMFLYSIISILSHRSSLALSLAGATGIIVSIGVTADSYIVYFERLKDDIRSGKTIRSTADRTFSRAYRTIVAADLVSFFAAAILYLFTVSSVRGFAFTLGLSTLLDLLTAFFFTRPMVILLARNRLFTEAPHFGVARGLAASPAGGTA
ncbi:MAG TPA: protein translocase subunit SecD, partial [Acidimicrobiales bacterium]|nr:protein translocase subunit SecD [Acidimicrobiales bacterium]